MEFLIRRSSARSGFHHGRDHLVIVRWGVQFLIAQSVMWKRWLKSSSVSTFACSGKKLFTRCQSVLFQLKPWYREEVPSVGEREKVMGTWSCVLGSGSVVQFVSAEVAVLWKVRSMTEGVLWFVGMHVWVPRVLVRRNSDALLTSTRFWAQIDMGLVGFHRGCCLFMSPVTTSAKAKIS